MILGLGTVEMIEVPWLLILHLAPCTLHLAPCTLHLAPCTLHLAPCTFVMRLERPLLFFDLETTGLDKERDRIIEFAGIKVHPDKRQERFESFVNP